MKCPSCGNELAVNARFCTKCGTAITQVPASKEPFVWKEQYTYIAIVAAIVLAAIIGFAVRVSKAGDNQTASDAVAENMTTNVEEYENQNIREEIYRQNDSLFEGEQENTGIIIDVEEQVLVIREEYNDIVEAVNSGSFEEQKLSNGIKAYYENDIIRSIVVPKNAAGNQYMQVYYYDSFGNIVFAYYEANDANRLYFYNFRLIRWRYSGNAEDAQNAENHDFENSDEYLYWEYTVLDDSYYYMQMVQKAYGIVGGEYILPESDSRYLDRQDLKGLTAEECRLARNELYARHGRLFDDEGIQAYFNTKEWYNGRIKPSDFKEDILNDYEVYNRDLIVKYEEEMGYR